MDMARALARRTTGRSKGMPRAAGPHVKTPPAKWRRRKDSRPEEILGAALAVFAEKGFAAARMDDIATRAGVTKGTIYLYFHSKEDVFEALLQQTVGSKIADLGAMLKNFDGTSAQLLTLMLRNIGQFISTSDLAVLPKIVIAEAGNFPELARFYRQEIIERGFGLLSGIIKSGIARGEFKQISIEHAVRLCVAPLLVAIIWRTVFARFDAQPYDYVGLIDTHIATLLKGLAKDAAKEPLA
jgi:AcrR family transcriptional regulator